MKVNPYVAAAVMALIAAGTAVHGALSDGRLSPAELVAAAIAALTSLSAALHIEPPRAAEKNGQEVIYVPTSEH